MDSSITAQLIMLVLKIAFIAFTLLHIVFLGFVLRRVVGMRNQLSTLKQEPVIYTGGALIACMVILLIYIILLP